MYRSLMKTQNTEMILILVLIMSINYCFYYIKYYYNGYSIIILSKQPIIYGGRLDIFQGVGSQCMIKGINSVRVQFQAHLNQ